MTFKYISNLNQQIMNLSRGCTASPNKNEHNGIFPGKRVCTTQKQILMYVK